MEYNQFIESKRIRSKSLGVNIDQSEVNPMLFPFQRDVVAWACRKGRAAIFLDTGLGKTFVQIEWARLIGQNTLIVAPLSVARQTVREASKIGVTVKYVRHQSECDSAICITNYEMIDEFDPREFGAVVLDESSILKSLDGETRRKLIDMFQSTPYRLACTATPAPNDQSEIGNHAQFLGVMTMQEMLASFFIHANKVDERMLNDGTGRSVKTKQSGDKGQEWRLKNHARDAFYRWMSSWSISLRKPSDLGYDDNGYILPALNVKPLFIDVDYVPQDQLFFTGMRGIQDRHAIRSKTLSDRVATAAEIVNASDDQWIVWCGLNDEGDALEAALIDCRQVQGSDDPESKAKAIEDFQDGKYRVLITKPKIAGFGMNFQNAHNMIFVGLSDSWESYYQCIRREWRFGQTREVNAYIVLSELEREIYTNVMQKEAMARGMGDELIARVQKYEWEELNMEAQDKDDYNPITIKGESFTAMRGDSAERLKEIETGSVHLSVYSPPFADLYTYSNSDRDLGNSKDWTEFFSHYAFIIRELLRVTKPGRLTCVHTSDIPAMAVKDGYIGMKDFPGAVIEAYEGVCACGKPESHHDGKCPNAWTFVGRAIVGKNPQAQAIRTKAKALLFTQLAKDSSHSRPAILDQILIFKAPGDNDTPIQPVKNGEMNNETWIDWASGIWLGISESDTLQFTTARDADDEKHICPLQLGTIERCIKLYSNPGETVLTPFGGIGSEAYQALRFNRRAIYMELKESYFKIGLKNLLEAEQMYHGDDLFSYAEKVMSDESSKP